MTIESLKDKSSLLDLWQKLAEIRVIAIEEAKKSPCVRRKYGAVSFRLDSPTVYAYHNSEVSECCRGGCIRDRFKIQHGMNSDVGAEIHAEQALLVAESSTALGPIFIAGLDRKGTPLLDKDCWPCYSCARMLKFGNIQSVWVPMLHHRFKVYSIAEILNTYNIEYEVTHGDA